ncbi:hypothetical protein PMAYCL1PPCAC_31099, partial [Pristionchus mayeri]
MARNVVDCKALKGQEAQEAIGKEAEKENLNPEGEKDGNGEEAIIPADAVQPLQNAQGTRKKRRWTIAILNDVMEPSTVKDGMEPAIVNDENTQSGTSKRRDSLRKKKVVDYKALQGDEDDYDEENGQQSLGMIGIVVKIRNYRCVNAVEYSVEYSLHVLRF